MSHFVYVIKSARTGQLYKGMTEDLVTRLATHNAGKVRSTKTYIPWVLVYHEEFRTRADARNREIYLKSGYGRKFLRDLGIGK